MFPRQNRLSNRFDLERVKKDGRRTPGKLLWLMVEPRNDTAPVRIACVVSARVAPTATRRNLIRRRMREAIRDLLPNLKEGHDLIFLAKPEASTASFRKLREDVAEIGERAGLVKLTE